MANTQRTRSSKRLARMEGNMSKEMSPGWNLAEETMLLTPDERSEWVEHVLPPRGKE